MLKDPLSHSGPATYNEAIICPVCGQECDELEFRCDGEQACPDCAAMVKCEYCMTWVSPDEATRSDDGDWCCDGCRDQAYHKPAYLRRVG